MGGWSWSRECLWIVKMFNQNGRPVCVSVLACVTCQSFLISPCPSLLSCLWSCPAVCVGSLRTEGGACCAAWVRGGGGRAQAWRAAVPRDLHDGAAATRHWLPRPGGSESRVSQPAGCGTRQQPQCCLALWSGQTDHFCFFVLLLTASALCVCLTFLLNCALTPRSAPHREESKPSCLAFTTSSAKQTPPLQVCYFFWFIFVLSDTVAKPKKWVHSVCCAPAADILTGSSGFKRHTR